MFAMRSFMRARSACVDSRSFLAASVASVLLGLIACPVRAEMNMQVPADPIHAVVTAAPDGGPYSFELRVSAAGQSFVANPGLFQVLVQNAGRTEKCRWSPPSRAASRRFVRVEDFVHRFDLRDVCFGRAWSAFQNGGRISATYGSPRLGYPILTIGPTRVRAISAIWRSPPPQPPAARSDAPVLDVSMGSQDVTVAPVRSQVTIHANRRVRAYIRPDLVSFKVSGPLGAVTCQIPRAQIVPLPDFFKTLGRTSLNLVVSSYCPRDTFSVAGIYEVTPVLTLPHSYTHRNHVSSLGPALLGTFEGKTALVRVRRGRFSQTVEYSATPSRPAVSPRENASGAR